MPERLCKDTREAKILGVYQSAREALLVHKRGQNIVGTSKCQRGSVRTQEKPKYWGYIRVPERLC